MNVHGLNPTLFVFSGRVVTFLYTTNINILMILDISDCEGEQVAVFSRIGATHAKNDWTADFDSGQY